MAAKGQGIGAALLLRLIEISEAEAFWTLQAQIIAENKASRGLHRKCGFREIGVRERLGHIGEALTAALLRQTIPPSQGRGARPAKDAMMRRPSFHALDFCIGPSRVQRDFDILLATVAPEPAMRAVKSGSQCASIASHTTLCLIAGFFARTGRAVHVVVDHAALHFPRIFDLPAALHRQFVFDTFRGPQSDYVMIRLGIRILRTHNPPIRLDQR